MTAWARITRAEQLADAAEITRRECEEQGIPFLVEDPVVLDRCARILTTPGGFDAEQDDAA